MSIRTWCGGWRKSDIAQANLIRNDGTGRMVNLNGPKAPRDIVLPENYTLRAITPAKDVPGRLGLSLVRNKKTKQADLIAPESFVAVLLADTPDEAVRDFLVEGLGVSVSRRAVGGDAGICRVVSGFARRRKRFAIRWSGEFRRG